MHYTLAVFHRKEQNVEDIVAKYKYHEREKNVYYLKYTRKEAIAYAKKYLQCYYDDFKDDNECIDAFRDSNKIIDQHGNIYTTVDPKIRFFDRDLMITKIHWNNQETYEVRVGDIDNWTSFTELNHGFPTYAVITPDGEWHEICDVWGLLSSQVNKEEITEWIDQYFERFLFDLHPDIYMSIFYIFDENDEHYMENLIKEAMGYKDYKMFNYKPASYGPR